MIGKLKNRSLKNDARLTKYCEIRLTSQVSKSVGSSGNGDDWDSACNFTNERDNSTIFEDDFKIYNQNRNENFI